MTPLSSIKHPIGIGALGVQLGQQLPSPRPSFLDDLVRPLDARLSISKLLPLFVAEWGVQVGHSPTHRAHRSRSAGRTAGDLAVAGIRGPLDLGSDQGAFLFAVEVASHHVERQSKILSFVVIGNLADFARVIDA